MCAGFIEDDHMKAVVRENDRGRCLFKVELERNADQGNSKMILSNNCKVLAMPQMSLCKECSALRAKLRRRQTSVADSPYVNDRFFGIDGMKAKLSRRTLQNELSDKRAKYWKAKFDNDSMVIEESQSSDLFACSETFQMKMFQIT